MTTHNDSQDFETKLAEARRKLPLKRLMENRGRAPANGQWHSFPHCPYCQGNQCAGVFSGAHGELFKCHRTDCPSGTAEERGAWDEIGFLAHELRLDRRGATRVWLTDAGLWPEAATAQTPAVKTQDEAGQGPGPETQAAPEVESESPLEKFVARLALTEADRAELKGKRGLSEDMIDRSGFRTNDRGNLSVLDALGLEYSEWQLVKCGLNVRTGNATKPSGQYYGYGVVGKKKRLSPALLASGEFDDFDEDDFVWAHKETGHCNPILIPYFDLQGKIIAVRPHKGFPKGQKPRLYVAGGRHPVLKCRQAVIVEGEFKAAALQDVIGDQWAVASVPGITQVKNFHVWGDILFWLRSLDARTVVVVFDNEEHGDPQLPGFRPQAEERHEAEVWARVCAVRLKKEGYEARVGQLPDAWRNEQGKADWDSALARMLAAGEPRPAIQAQFLNVLQQAIPVADLSKARRFDPATEQIIKDRVEVRTYSPALPWGGQAEQKLARDLRQLAAGKLRDWAGRVTALAEAYERTKGWYYELKLSEQHSDKLQRELQAAATSEEIRFLRLALEGTPSLVAPLQVIPLYVLVKPDGSRHRLVRLKNIRGEISPVAALDEDSLTGCREWRRWLARQGNYGWEKGEHALQALQRDLNFVLARREVLQLVHYGGESPGKPWFLDDCAFAGDGAVIRPNEEGIYGHEGRGYSFVRDPEKNIPIGGNGQLFRLKGAPRMQPDLGLVFGPDGGPQLAAGRPDDPQAVRELLGNLMVALNASFGGYDGLMLLASTIAYFAGPEVFRWRNEFPGIWIYGPKGGGKTFTAKWLCALHGFSDLDGGLGLKTSTAAGVQIMLGQYANQPAWVDEFKENELREPRVIGVIHSGFNREVPSKHAEDGRPDTIRTSCLVTGETTCGNSATMSRFVTALAARERREGTEAEQLARFNWLQDHRRYFFVIGRAVLRQRGQFAARLIEHLTAWERLPALAGTDSRGRYCHGISYAAWLALNEIIPVCAASQLAQFQKWLIEKTKTSTCEVADRLALQLFFKDLVNMQVTGWFGKTAEEISRYFKVVKNRNAPPRFSERQLKDAADDPRRDLKAPCLAIRPGPVFALWHKYLRHQGRDTPQSQSDVQAELKVCAYYVPGPRQGHQMKFGRGARSNSYCWLIDLARFEDFGLREVSDEAWEQSFYQDGDSNCGVIPASEWVDPRKGELFTLVDALKEEDDGHLI
jgi:hypothetical protein